MKKEIKEVADFLYFGEDICKNIRNETGKATTEMLRSLKNDDLSMKEKDEWYGYIRAMRDIVYMLNCQKNGECQAQNDLQKAYELLNKNLLGYYKQN